MRCFQSDWVSLGWSLLLILRSEAFVSPGATLSSRSVVGGRSLLCARSTRATTAAVETIEDAKSIILGAAERRDQDPDAVIEAIRLIERKGGSKQPLKGGDEGAKPNFDLLTTNGKWRLVFTTGDVKTQKKIGGKLTYIPIKAVQVFNPDYTITNGVYLGSFPLLEFAGTFTWQEDKSRLEFTFNQVGVLGLRFPYNQGESKVQPGFTFMDISDRYVIARGAGGGLALWLRQDSI